MSLLDTFRTSISPKKSVVSNDQRIVNRHYQLLDQINAAYREKNYDLAARYCQEDIGLFPDFRKAYKKVHPDEYALPRIPSFEVLAKIYDKQGKYEELISVCELAIKYRQKDGTKGGYKARIEKAKKMLEGK